MSGAGVAVLAAGAVAAGWVAVRAAGPATTARRARRRLPAGRGAGRSPAPLPVAAAWRRVATRALAARRAAGAERALPGWLDAVARGVRSGASLRAALVEAAGAVAASPLGPVTGALAADLGAGRPLAEALVAFGAPPAPPGRQLAARSLALVAGVGGAPAGVVDGVAATARDRLAVRGEVRALSTQARASAVVITLAPVAFAVVASSADARVGGFLVGSPVGWACLAAGLALDGLGAAWMARLVHRVAR